MYDWIGRLTRSKSWPKVGRVLSWLPDSFIYALLVLAGRLVCIFAFAMRRRIETNMQEVLLPFGYSRAQVRKMARSYFVQLTAALFELLFAEGRLTAKRKPKIRMSGEEHLKGVLDEGKGAIVYAPHTGNFFYYYWKLSHHYDCLAVATAGSHELQPIYLSFERLGCKGIDYDETPPLTLMRKLKAHLSGGGVVFLLGDFYRDIFPEIRMFERRTRLPTGAAVLALDMQIPVIPCSGRRVSRLNHLIELGKPVRLYELYGRNSRKMAMEELGRVMETNIMKAPEQWFYWFQSHERWIPNPQSNSLTS